MTVFIPEQCLPVCSSSGYDFSSAAESFVDATLDASHVKPLDIFQIGKDLNYFANGMKNSAADPHKCLMSCFESSVEQRMIELGLFPDSYLKKDDADRYYPLPLSLMIGKMSIEELQLAADLFNYDYFAGLTGWKRTVLEIVVYGASIFACAYGILNGVAAGMNSFTLGTNKHDPSSQDNYL